MRVLERLLCCCGGQQHSNHNVLETTPLTNVFDHQSKLPHIDFEDSYQQTCQARERLWARLGKLEPITLGTSHTQGSGPKWPAHRQRFVVVRRPTNTVIIASDGLSDPFDDAQQQDENVNGFGLEFYIEVPAKEVGPSIAEIKKSWAFQLLFTIAQLAASHGGIRHIIDDMRLLSTEAEGVHLSIPQQYKATHVNTAGRVGALLGLEDDTPTTTDRLQQQSIPTFVDFMPLTDVRLVNLKLVTLSELKLITERGAEGRRKLAELFKGKDRLVSSLERPSML